MSVVELRSDMMAAHDFAQHVGPLLSRATKLLRVLNKLDPSTLIVRAVKSVWEAAKRRLDEIIEGACQAVPKALHAAFAEAFGEGMDALREEAATVASSLKGKSVLRWEELAKAMPSLTKRLASLEELPSPHPVELV